MIVTSSSITAPHHHCHHSITTPPSTVVPMLRQLSNQFTTRTSLDGSLRGFSGYPLFAVSSCVVASVEVTVCCAVSSWSLAGRQFDGEVDRRLCGQLWVTATDEGKIDSRLIDPFNSFILAEDVSERNVAVLSNGDRDGRRRQQRRGRGRQFCLLTTGRVTVFCEK
uniref:Uncharacterized protein n=1 Tax=Setaria digitata TaxID=48799 RepID=A0A915PM55_9BILA